MAHHAKQNLFQLGVAHLPMPDADPRLGHKFLNRAARMKDGIDAVVNEIDLTLPRLSSCSMAALMRSVLKCATSVLIANRSLGGVSITDMSRKPEQRHVKRSRNGRSAHGQRVHIVLQLLQPLFVLARRTAVLRPQSAGRCRENSTSFESSR